LPITASPTISLTHALLGGPISGRGGAWFKADPVVYFDHFTIKSGR
jgi:hypothetical protein